ncbi:AraC family transcriptional regulator [Dyadobacter sp. CY326]|uniref:helix-turn-helix domain-containing protein n=1 Tax=Dyadobacter sp. CY326 TaxID=2907300 RepID=UPI001F439DA8|nr:helix-turn-helix transcriptional regulator [Dyadobacter sp. CY326]MCE7064069.1 helix-turn-helix transcriptional regulator [Dyadobacter sp. CY326]
MDQHSIETYAPQLNGQHNNAGGYFVAVRLEEFSAASLAATAVYSRKDFYKISLINGHASYFYQDQEYLFDKDDWALVFTNREVPYRWEVHEGTCNGYACMFTEDFLPLPVHIRPSDWAVFNGNAPSVFKLTGKDKIFFEGLFLKMLDEQDSAYAHKFDLLFLYVQECIHGAQKFDAGAGSRSQTAATRLTSAFKNLLAGQFPLAYPNQQVTLRTPQDYADRLAVHTNHLNRALKEVTGRTTTQLINERIMQEARTLMLHSNWTISQIGNSLGFEEATHFARAFRQHTGKTPSAFRQ